MKLKLPDFLSRGRHHEIEKFGITVLVMTLLLGGSLGTSGYAAITRNHKILERQALFTSQFEMSKSKASGQVLRVFENDSRTKAFVLLKFSDMSKMSSDAKTYKMFLLTKGGSNHHPSGAIYVFGQTGYVGLYLVDSEGFSSKLQNIVLRANAQLVPDSAKADPTKDASFAKYDQTLFSVNLGAKVTDQGSISVSEATNSNAIFERGVTITAQLNDEPLDSKTLFNSLVAENLDKETRLKLADDLNTMKYQLNLIDEYTKRLQSFDLDGRRIVIPETMASILGDSIIEKDGVPYLETQYVFPKGYNFNWQDMTFEGGYAKNIVPEGMNTLDYMLSVSQDMTARVPQVRSKDWFLSDGSAFSDLQRIASDSTVVKTAGELVSGLTSAWSSYAQLKEQYQCTDLKKLLDIELSAKSAAESTTVHAGETALTSN